jgi:proteasome lid subunit RPN8/RPN11
MLPRHIVFTKRAFNAIVTEALDKHPLETGGIFIGYFLNNGIWVVVETIPPGIKTTNQRAYFEYDTDFINYLSNVVAKQYSGNLQVLGLWHRHPGSMDVFSSTDDDTNVMFAKANSLGAISGLINYDPKMRLTLYHVDEQCHYTKTDWSVDDGIIPESLLELRFNGPEDFPSLEEQSDSGLSVPDLNSLTPDARTKIIQNQEPNPSSDAGNPPSNPSDGNQGSMETQRPEVSGNDQNSEEKSGEGEQPATEKKSNIIQDSVTNFFKQKKQ